MSDGIGIGFSSHFNTGDDGSNKPEGAKGGAQLDPVRGPGELDATPLRILALANFCGAPAERTPRVERAHVEELDALMAKLGVSMFFTVEDQLRRDPKGLEVRLTPTSLGDLLPGGVAEALPAFDLPRKLLAELTAVEAKQMTRAQFRDGLSIYAEVPALAEAVRLAEQLVGRAPSEAATTAPLEAPDAPKPPTASKDGDSVLDNIFSLVDAPAEEPAAPPPPAKKTGGSAIGAAISAIGGSKGKGTGELAAAADAVRAVLERQLNAIVHHPQFREVEAAWLGLKFLLQRARGAKVRIDVLDSARADVADVFHEHVFPVEYEGRSESPLGLTVVDFGFANTAADLAILERLAADAEAIQAPALVSLQPDFFRVPPAEVARLSNPRTLFETGFEAWEGRRKADSSRWLACVYNRLLLRAPHEAGRRVGPFGEQVTGAEELLWGNGGWAVAACAARSMASTGWPANLAGARDGELTDLPLWLADGASEGAGPVEAALSQDCVDDLAAHGITALTARKGRDTALVLRATVLKRPGPDEPKMLGHLGYQLLAARLGEAVLGYKAKLSGVAPDQVVGKFEAYLKLLLGETGPGAHAVVQGMPDPDDPQRLLIGMTATTGRAVLGGVEVHLGVRV